MTRTWLLRILVVGAVVVAAGCGGGHVTLNGTATAEPSTATGAPPDSSAPAASPAAKQYSHACPAGDSATQADGSRLSHKLVANGQDTFCPPHSTDQPGVSLTAIQSQASGWPFYPEVSAHAPPAIHFCLFTSGPQQDHPAPGTSSSSWADRTAWVFVFSGVTSPVPPPPGAAAAATRSETALYVADASTGTLLYSQFGSHVVQY